MLWFRHWSVLKILEEGHHLVTFAIWDMIKRLKVEETNTVNGHWVKVKVNLRLKQEEPKMCHTPKVEDEVENLLFTSWTRNFGHIFKNFTLPYIINR